MDADSTRQSCLTCGYNLFGLPQQGRCPECGNPYRPEDLRAAVSRPTFGWLGLLLPAALIALAYFVGMWTFFCGGFVLVFGSLAAAPVLSFAIGYRIARWRSNSRRPIQREKTRSARTYVIAVTVVLALLQIALCSA